MYNRNDVYVDDGKRSITKYWYIELYILNHKQEPYHPTGSEYSILYDDLKTLTGVLNRLKRHIPFDTMAMPVIGFKIFSYYNYYGEDSYMKYVDTIEPYNKYDNIFGSVLKAQHDFFRNGQWIIPKENL